MWSMDPQVNPKWRDIAEAFDAAKEVRARRAVNLLAQYHPYPFQFNFHKAEDNNGARAMQRLLMAANRVGKTWAGSFETAMHATGEYPDWWKGEVIEHPELIWAGGLNNDKVRDIAQKQLCGNPADPDAWGTGTIPKKNLKRKVRKPGIPDALESVLVKHKNGHNVTIAFKSYEAGSKDWMGEKVSVVWLDEEPDQTIYGQALARTVDTGGILYMTFTPENGATMVVQSFMNEIKPGQQLYRATWDDAPHLTEQAKAQIWAAIPEYERDMRSRGVPMVGSGLVFSVPDEDIICDPLVLPRSCWYGNGMDFGWDHPTAVAYLAWDRTTDVVYLYDGYRARKTLPPMVAQNINGKGRWIPTFWPRDGLQADKGSGVSLADQYRDLNVNMWPLHFTNPPTADDKGRGTESVEPGLMDMLQRMTSGRFKVFSTVTDFLEEKRAYHRKDGKLVKLNDDLISAARYGSQSRRFFVQAKPPKLEEFAIRSLSD